MKREKYQETIQNIANTCTWAYGLKIVLGTQGLPSLLSI